MRISEVTDGGTDGGTDGNTSDAMRGSKVTGGMLDGRLDARGASIAGRVTGSRGGGEEQPVVGGATRSAGRDRSNRGREGTA